MHGTLHVELSRDVTDKGCVSRKAKEVREGAIQISGEEHSRKRE